MGLLDRYISTVASRFRHLAWWRSMVWLALIATALGLVLMGLQSQGYWLHENSGRLLITVTICGVILVSVCTFFRYQDRRWVARAIENRFPELQQRLLTTLDQLGQNRGGPLSYLQHNVVQETLYHAQTHRWKSTVPARQLRTARIGAVAAGMLACLTIFGLLRWQPPAGAVATSWNDFILPTFDFDIEVEPGDTEIEQGGNLLVVARFGKQVPKLAELVVQRETGEERLPMSRSLEDPLFGGSVVEVQAPFQYRVAYDGQTSPTYQVQIFTYPELIRSDALLEYPSYTGNPEKRIEDTFRVTAVEGTRLTWLFHLNKPVASARLLPLEDAPQIELLEDPTDKTQWAAPMELTQSGAWRLQLTDEAGRENRNPPRLSVKVIPNRPPDVKLELARDARVSPLEEFQVQATMSDDFGLRKYGLTYKLASTDAKEITLGEQSERREKMQAEHLLDFERLAAEPDQLLSYYFWAEDHDAAGQPRRTMSDMFFAEVRHFEEIFRQGQQPPGGQQQQQQQQNGQQSQNAQDAEQLAELQKQIMNATWRLIRREVTPEVTPVFKDDVSVIVESQQAALEQTQQLGQGLNDPESQTHMLEVRSQMQTSLKELTDAFSQAKAQPLTPALQAQQAAYQALLKLRAREHEVTRQQQSSSSSSSSASRQRMQQQLQQLELDNKQNRYETQRQAQQQEEEEESEIRQALSRLRELAQRQEDLNKQLQELQNALEQAETEEARKEIERQLKRLRDQQQEMLRDTDELMDRLNESQSQDTLQETREQLEQTREQLRDSAQSLEQGEVTPALASGTRAQRELEEMREELRRESANQFTDRMRDMRDQARDLENRQQEIGQQLADQGEQQEDAPGLRQDGSPAQEQLGDALREQSERLNELLQEIEQTVLEAEETEPLLAEELYDGFRETERTRVSRNLDVSAELSDRGLTAQARQLESEAREGISNLREHIDRAAESVLGDETAALRRALSTLDELQRQVNEEIEQFDGSRGPQEPRDGAANEASATEPPGEGQRTRSDREAADQPRNPESPGQNPPTGETQSSEQGRPSPSERSGEQQGEAAPSDEPREQEASGSQQGQGQPQQSQERTESTEQFSPGQGESSGESSEASGGQPEGQAPSSEQRGQGRSGSRREGEQSTGGERSNRPSPLRSLRAADDAQPRRDGGGLGGGAFESLGSAPITGDDYRNWSDALRDVEEIVDDPELRAEAARIRDRAKAFRGEYKRESKEPRWNLVRELVAEPLRELRREISQELLRRSAERNELVPIDRDPVPDEFVEQVRRYYENLGSGE